MWLKRSISQCVRTWYRLVHERTDVDIYRLIDEAEIVSFDVFDTLVYREVLLPTDVFSLIEAREGVKGFAHERREAELRAISQRRVGEDVSLDSIYAELGKYESLKSVEVDTEVSICRRNRMLDDIWGYAQKQCRFTPSTLRINTLHARILSSIFTHAPWLNLSESLWPVRSYFFAAVLQNGNIIIWMQQ